MVQETTTTFIVSLGLDSIAFNATQVEPEEAESKNIIISADVVFYLDIYLHCLVCGCIGLFGTVGNIINMIIFHKLGVNDSMTVSLVALAVSDCIGSFIVAVTPAFVIWNLLLPNYVIDPLAIHYVTIAWWRDILFLVSSWITTYLSIERCVCVVFPFRVKDIFTKGRAIVIMIIIYIVHACVYMPVFVTQWLRWTQVALQVNNQTIFKDRLIVDFSTNRDQIMLYLDIANGAVLPIPSQALIVISVIWMVFGLKISSRIRQTKSIKSDKDDSKQSNLSMKERRLVKVVMIIAVILVVCNIPRYIGVYARQIYPNMYFRNPDEHLYAFIWIIAGFFNTINSSVNIFAYMTVNTSYRQKFKELFCAGKLEKN